MIWKRLNLYGALWGIISFAFALSLAACTSSNATPPTLAITTPGSLVSTTPVQSAAEGQIPSRIDLFVRGKGGSEDGLLAASAVQAPYVIAWNTLAVPKSAELKEGDVGSLRESTCKRPYTPVHVQCLN